MRYIQLKWKALVNYGSPLQQRRFKIYDSTDMQDSQPHKYCLTPRCVFAECHHSESTETVIYYGLVIKSFKCKKTP